MAVNNESASAGVSSPDQMDERAFARAVQSARQAATAYYDTDVLLMSDAEYDALVDTISAAKSSHPEWDDQGVLTEVAAGASAGGSLTHPQRLLSLNKTTDPLDIASFVDAVVGDVVVEMKIDGNAIRATYVDTKLAVVASRGDGVTGEPIDVGLEMDGLPATIGLLGEVTLTGEVYMTADDFERSNVNRLAAGLPGFANARNAAAGVLRREAHAFEAFLSFAAYHATSSSLDALDDYSERMAVVGRNQVRTVQALQSELGLGFPPTSNADAVAADIEVMLAKRAELPVGIDGVVVKAASYKTREIMGAATRHPRWALAYKYPPMEATSFLARIDVSVGRTGRMSLTGVLDPAVDLDGVRVQRATLHNPAFVREQGLGIGSKVLVTRQGDVIPRIVGALGDKGIDIEAWQPPATCPTCDVPWNTSEVIWRCETPSCSTVGRITYAASRDVLDVDGLGAEVATALVEAGHLNDVADLFTLTPEQVAETQIGLTKRGKPRRIGELVARRMVHSIGEAKSKPLSRILCALGIPKLGPTMSRRLAGHFGTLQAIRNADVATMSEVEGVAEGKAIAYVKGLAEMSEVIDRLVAAGVTTEVRSDEPAIHRPLEGMKVAVTGSMSGSPLEGLNRNRVNEIIEGAGGTPASSVTAETSLLVCGETGSSKHAKALTLGVAVVSPNEFAALIRPFLEESGP